MAKVLDTICKTLYPSDLTVWIDQCRFDSHNQEMSPAVLNVIKNKCLHLTPLHKARSCAEKNGMSILEPDDVVWASDSAKRRQKTLKQPDVSWIEGKTPLQECTSKCDRSYLQNAMSYGAWKDCISKCYEVKIVEKPKSKEPELPPPAPEKKRPERAEEDKEVQRTATPWGRFAFKLAYHLRRNKAQYNDAFQNWNTNPHDTAFTPTANRDAVIDSGWQHGVHLSLGTDGLTRMKDSNVLMRFTGIDLGIYNSSELSPFYQCYNEIDNKCELIKFGTELLGNMETLDSPNNLHLTLGDFEWQIPFFERNFFEIGFSLLKSDEFWWRSANPLFPIIPFNVRIGLNWQFNGSPVTVDDKVLDITGMSYVLSSYTMLGANAEIAGVNYFPLHKAAAFCSQTSADCKQYNNSRYFMREFSDPDYSGISVEPNSDRDVQFRLRTHLFGEERGASGGVAYRGYVDFYPVWEKLEFGATFSAYWFWGKAMEFSLGVQGRSLYSYGDDGEIMIPDRGFSLEFMSGISLRPSAWF